MSELSETAAPPPVVTITSKSAFTRSGAPIGRPNVTLRNLRRIRTVTGLHRKDIEKITTAAGRPITEDRQQKLEVGPTRYEPWYWEARDLSRILLLDGILPLFSDLYGDGMNASDLPPGHLLDFSLGDPEPGVDDHALWKRGVALPLSHACRVAASMSLEDPIHLEQVALDVELWSVIGRNERGAAPGQCPWCLGVRAPDTGEIAHLETCIPNRRWSPHRPQPYLTDAVPQPARGGKRGTAAIATNLRRLRKEKHLTMEQLGSAIGVHMNYISRIERCEVGLTDHKAGLIAQYLGCRIKDLY